MGQTVSRKICDTRTGTCIGSSEDVQRRLVSGYKPEELRLYGSEQQCLQNCGGLRLISPSPINDWPVSSIILFSLVLLITLYIVYRLYRK